MTDAEAVAKARERWSPERLRGTFPLERLRTWHAVLRRVQAMYGAWLEGVEAAIAELEETERLASEGDE